MRILVCGEANAELERLTQILHQAGAVSFLEPRADQIPTTACKEYPDGVLMLTAPESREGFRDALERLTEHPEGRWLPVAAACLERPTVADAALLDSGASLLVDLTDPPEIVEAILQAFLRSTQCLTALRSAQLTDSQTGFYHRNFLLDQLAHLCRKRSRDGADFCFLLFEFRGDDAAIAKSAAHLASTIRGADLFGRWEADYFATLLPSSTPSHAAELAARALATISSHGVEAKTGLAWSAECAAEPEAMLEAASNALDRGWQDDSAFLWRWRNDLQDAEPVPLPTGQPS